MISYHTDGQVCPNDRSLCLRWHTTTTPLVDGDVFRFPDDVEWIDRFGAVVGKPKPSPRASMLREAETLITGDRNNQYGPPTQDFQRTADLLNALGYRRVDAEDLVHEVVPSDVALIIAQVKMSRIIHSRHKRDSWVDLAGYAACGYECAEEESGAS